MGEEVVETSEGVATNKNGLGVEFESRNFKAQLGEIRVVVCVISGMSLNGEVRFLTHEFANHVLLG
jgi:hypothetical protein